MTGRDEAIQAAAKLLREAEQTRTGVPPLAGTWPEFGVTDAYAIQLVNTRRRLADGERLLGRKVGLTSAAMQAMFGIDQPDYGQLLSPMFLPDGGSVPASRFLAPRVEVEIGFILGSRLAGPGIGVADVLAATSAVCTAIEVIDSRIADWRITLVDTIADNASSAGLVLGAGRASPGALDLAALEAELLIGGQVRERGQGSAVLGHPAAAVAWLANTLAGHGESLAAGQVILPGACTRALPVAAGDEVEARFGGLGSASIRFTAGQEGS